MILPIIAYGNPVLKIQCEEIRFNYPDLDDLIKNMWETMYSANGVGVEGCWSGGGVNGVGVEGW